MVSDRASTAGCGSRSAAPRVLTEELNKLATAIGDAAREIKDKTERIELDAAEKRCRGLADELSGWLHQEDSEAVYWVEVEEKHSRLRECGSPPRRWMSRRHFANSSSRRFPPAC